MPDTPDYLVTARSVNPLSRSLDDAEPRPVRHDLAPFRTDRSPLRTPASFRRAWFEYVRESSDDR